MDTKSRDFFQTLVENSPYGILLTDTEGTIVYSNPAHYTMMGYAKGELIGRSFSELVADGKKKEHIINFYRRVIQDHPEPISLYSTDLKKSGEKIYTKIDWRYMYTDDGELDCIVSFVSDITPQRDAEQQLVRSKRKNEAILSAIPDLLYVINSEGICTDYHETGQDLFDDPRFPLGKSVDEIFPQKVSELFHEKIERCLREKIFQFCEYELSLDGPKRFFESRFVPYPLEAGHVLVINRDISNRKRAEEHTLSLLGEKDLLMRELNHRVKNNLMMITSLIHLRSAESSQPEELQELLYQVDAIRLIHEKLTRYDSYTHIDFHSYADDILSTVFRFAKFEVVLENRIPSMSIPVKIAVSMGLLLNELATNAVKHGFQQGAKALFSVSFTLLDSGHYLLSVYNSGKDFPETINLQKPSSLGLQLVASLVSQLRGHLELHREDGTRFNCSVPDSLLK